MKQILISILVLFFNASTCNAQLYRKAATSVTKRRCVNKAIIGAGVVRTYSIQERQRRQIAQKLAHQTFQSASLLNSVAVANARLAAPQKSSALLPPPHLYDLKKLDNIVNLNDSTLINFLTTMPTNSKFVDDNH